MNDKPNPEPTNVETPPPTAEQPPPLVVSPTSKKSLKKPLLILLAMVVVAAIAGGFWLLGKHSAKQSATTTAKPTQDTQPIASPPTSKGLQLDPNKNYGNKYASGLLPVGDGKDTTEGAKVGSVYVCSQYAQNLKSDQGGAGSRGPWFTNNNTQYDINKKARVQGSVMWQADFSNTLSGNTRTITTNDLPTHPTGTFPIGRSDPAYSYDRNPNSIKSQTLTYKLSTNPTYGSPQCMGGEVGIMLTGVALFNAFDAGGRDAGAWEVQDSCSGHPQVEGEYHYHTLSSCIKDVSVHTVIGYALDGFPITGPQVGPNSILATSDLDECHGLTSPITLDGKTVTMYHYVMTEDFPYSVSCFRAQAIQPPGMQSGPPTRSPSGRP